LSSAKVELKCLKRFVVENLPRDSPLRVLLEEKDLVPTTEFLAKMQVWLALLRHGEK